VAVDAAADLDGLLSGLDPEQRHAVTTDSALVAVVAGAGSGKTRVLTRRIAWRVHAGTADPRHMLGVTFTREPAGELRRRLRALGLRDRIEAGTFHSVMLSILRQHWSDRRRSIPSVISDRRRLLAEIISEAGPSNRRRSDSTPTRYPADFDDLVAEVDWASSRGYGATRYCSEAREQGRRPPRGVDAVGAILAEYELQKQRRGVIDLDDVLKISAESIQTDAELARVLRWRFRHLLVDEAQDLNPLQHQLVDLLRADHDDLFLVGDPAQAIYGFTGADPSLLVDVSERFRGVEIIRLQTNHRCSPQVVDVGRHVIVAAGMSPTAIASSQPDAEAIRILSVADEHAEADRVAAWLRSIDPDAVRNNDVAVLARTHAQLKLLRERLSALGIPLRRHSTGPGSPYRAGIEGAARQRTPTELRVWAHDLLEDLEHGDHPVVPETVEVAGTVLEFLREQPRGDGPGFRTWMTAMDPLGLRADRGVELLTFHAAKGREWNAVAVTGVETGLVPHRSATTNAGRSEEARLLYVALTRARSQLLIVWAERRGGYRRRPSPLIEGFTAQPPDPALPPDDVLPMRRRVRSDRAFEALRAWRATTARSVNILPEQLCSDHVLRTIASSRPDSPEQLAAITGTGLLTANRWYPALRTALAGSIDDSDQSTNSAITGA